MDRSQKSTWRSSRSPVASQLAGDRPLLEVQEHAELAKLVEMAYAKVSDTVRLTDLSSGAEMGNSDEHVECYGRVFGANLEATRTLQSFDKGASHTFPGKTPRRGFTPINPTGPPGGEIQNVLCLLSLAVAPKTISP